MNNKLVLNNETKFNEAIKLLDLNGNGVLPVVDEEEKLLGLITDGDIRKAILNNHLILENIINKNPYKLHINASKEQIISYLKKIHRRHIPLVDDENKFIKVFTLDEIDFNLKPNWVVIMVGGLGTRLRPLTETTPKPMLKVGNKPILQTIVEKFAEYGYTNIVMCVNYKSDIIQDYFKDGSNFGVNIEYILEEQRMGTAGALSLLKDKPNEPFFVMNGDLLTNVNFENLHNYHIATNSIATMCVREYDFQVPYGVVNIKDSKIVSIEEKPTHKFFVNAGIYMLSSEVLNYIPKNEFFDMPSLFNILIGKNKKILSFPIHEYWLDIGRMSDFEQAQNEYFRIFNEK